jgi:ATP-binding cassette subfamily B protein
MLNLNFHKKAINFFYIVRNIYGRENDYKFAIILIFQIISALLEVLSIALVLPIIDLILNNGELSFLKFNLPINELNTNKLIFLIILLYTIKSFLLILINRYQLKVTINISKVISNKLLKKFLDEDYTFFTKNNNAFLLRNINYDTYKFSQSFLPSLMKLFSDFIILLFLILLLMQFNFEMTIIFLIFFGLLGGSYLYFVKKILFDLGKITILSEAKKIKFLQEGFRSFQIIKSFNLKNFFSKKFEIQNTISHSSFYHERLYAFLPKILFELSVIIFILLSIYFFLNFFDNRDAILMQITIFGLVCIRLMPILNSIISGIQNVRFNLIIVHNLDKIYNSKKKVRNILKIKKKITKNFSLKDVFYKYPGTNKFVLNNLNFSFKKGDIISITGHSGAGKSTLLNIIMGYLQVDKGIISINDKQIKKNEIFNIENLGYVPQNSFLLDNNIKNNIILNKTYNEKKLIKAIQLSGLADFYKKASNKKIFLGDGGIKVSGGQKQRIALARVLYNNSDIIILDEPTSSVDLETRSKIYQSLKEINKKNNCTIIIVSHDIINSKITNRNFHLKNGKLKKIK